VDPVAESIVTGLSAIKVSTDVLAVLSRLFVQLMKETDMK
jgi:hypothetical protein